MDSAAAWGQTAVPLTFGFPSPPRVSCMCFRERISDFSVCKSHWEGSLKCCLLTVRCSHVPWSGTPEQLAANHTVPVTWPETLSPGPLPLLPVIPCFSGTTQQTSPSLAPLPGGCPCRLLHGWVSPGEESAPLGTSSAAGRCSRNELLGK